MIAIAYQCVGTGSSALGQDQNIHSVESDDKTLETSLTLLTFVLLLHKEGPCDQTDFIFEITEYDYIYISSYFTSILCFMYLQFSYAI